MEFPTDYPTDAERLYSLLCNIAIDIERIAEALEEIAGGQRFELESDPKVRS